MVKECQYVLWKAKPGYVGSVTPNNYICWVRPYKLSLVNLFLILALTLEHGATLFPLIVTRHAVTRHYNTFQATLNSI